LKSGGNSNYQFDQLRGIAIYRQFGQILVAEREGAQYLWVGVDVDSFRASVRADSIWRDLDVDFRLTEPAFLDLTLQDSFGRFIAQLARGQRFTAGAGHLSWGTVLKGRRTDEVGLPALPPEYHVGERLPAGEYLLRAQFRATYSSRESFHRDAEARVFLR